MSANQDNGVTEQSAPNNATWNIVPTTIGGIGDGASVAVSDSGTSSTQYWSFQQFGDFSRRTCNGANVCTAAVTVGLNVTNVGGGTPLTTVDANIGCNTCRFDTPVVANAVLPARLAIGTAFNVYESNDRGDNLLQVPLAGGVNFVQALVYGGRQSGVDKPNVMWLGEG